MSGPFVGAYNNEDDDYMVPVEDWPDRDAAGQGLANDTGCIYTFEGRGVVTVQDCEHRPTLDDCPDNPGHPCNVRHDLDCWHFMGWDYPSPETEADIASDKPDRDISTHPIYRPSATRETPEP